MADATTFTHNNWVGPMYSLTPQVTAFLTLAGMMSFDRAGGVMTVRGPEIQIQTVTGESNDTSSDANLEGQADPAASHVNPARRINVVEIIHEMIGVSTTAESSPDLIATFSPAVARTQLGEMPVRSKMNFQTIEKVKLAARKVNDMYVNGSYAYPADNVTARKTRGIIAATTTNEVLAAAATLASTHVDALVLDIVDSGGTFTDMWAFAGSFQRQKLSAAYTLDTPRTRFVAGVRVDEILTDFGTLNVVFERDMPAGTVQVADMSYVDPVWMIQSENGVDKGLLIVEDVPRTGLSYQKRLSGETGLQHGPEEMHGKITGLATT